MEKGPLRRESRNIFFWLSIIGPGIITANVDNDAGGQLCRRSWGEFTYAILTSRRN